MVNNNKQTIGYKMPTLTPTYGTDYKSKKAVIEAFNRGEDFYVVNGVSYGAMSKGDLVQEGIKEVKIRYNKLTQVTIVKL
jgi:hypothetical protein